MRVSDDGIGMDETTLSRVQGLASGLLVSESTGSAMRARISIRVAESCL